MSRHLADVSRRKRTAAGADSNHGPFVTINIIDLPTPSKYSWSP